jgi:uncharacterized protein YdaU (DUF1376 family)
MAELPILPLKTDALLADTTHMSAEEFGVYCRLLFVMWRHGGKLKDDDCEMATIGGVTQKRWGTIKEKVMRPMTAIGGLVSQGRLTDTWMQVQALRRKRADAADVGWRSRPRANAMQMHKQNTSKTDANAMQKQSNSNANQNQISKTTTSLDTARARENPTKSITASDDLAAVIQKKEWVQP